MKCKIAPRAPATVSDAALAWRLASDARQRKIEALRACGSHLRAAQARINHDHKIGRTFGFRRSG
jgi:hypothetical protein